MKPLRYHPAPGRWALILGAAGVDTVLDFFLSSHDYAHSIHPLRSVCTEAAGNSPDWKWRPQKLEQTAAAKTRWKDYEGWEAIPLDGPEYVIHHG
ncbi:hypothetical protein PABY_23240 [Pyrodictium abyssi]|uniref:Uncharacterized protein n=1 Tax=Pyrodictium abyssi TaxID=54256 RepID=A0ABM8IYY5_9CREN|nr:hypothetical protein PABY_23240 [Pyrodictium abyssi]